MLFPAIETRGNDTCNFSHGFLQGLSLLLAKVVIDMNQDVTNAHDIAPVLICWSSNIFILRKRKVFKFFKDLANACLGD
jgi:hypothetical protein